MRSLFFVLILFIVVSLHGQTGSIYGTVSVYNTLEENAKVIVFTDSPVGAQTNSRGQYHIDKIPYGTYKVTASYIGTEKQTKTITISKSNPKLESHFNLKGKKLMNEVVISATKTYKRKTNSPVIVNVINAQTLDNVQACNLSEGLKFQPGLRVETDCQTCNYTQLRINGLAGGYSQILINGRPIFSPLTGLYGLEQIPGNMISRIEVIRGGGSSLYGSSAIGGTVNVITKLRKKNTYEINSFYQNVNGRASDYVLNGNASVVSKNKKSGISLFFNLRERELYDHNDDNFSELPLLENTSIGSNMFFLPTNNQKLELNISNLNEYRYGGEMVEKEAYLTQQSEERKHNIWMGSADYQINFNEDRSSLITYAAWQNTKRGHYTGIFPDDSLEVQQHIENPPYGISNTTTVQAGLQLNHKVYDFFKGTNTFTLGTEYLVDDVLDNISSYNYLIDQVTRDLGIFMQSDWEISPQLNLLSGIRMDNHNLVDEVVFSPRVSLLYKRNRNTQLRLSYGSGFRAPQAFDADLHIAFAGGGVSRVSLSPDLRPERSHSISASINYDKPMEKWVAGYTIESFYTHLNNAFFLQPISQDSFGQRFEKQNGQGAAVRGMILELRANYEIGRASCRERVYAPV